MTISDDDDTLMSQLCDAVHERATVTDRAREAARAAFSWRTIDEELMDLVHDSATAGEVLVRGFVQARVFGFRSPDLNLEVEFDQGMVTGQVEPGRTCQVSIVSRDADLVVLDTDETGFFTHPFVAVGSVRFVVEVDGERLSTAWVAL